MLDTPGFWPPRWAEPYRLERGGLLDDRITIDSPARQRFEATARSTEPGRSPGGNYRNDDPDDPVRLDHYGDMAVSSCLLLLGEIQPWLARW